ncbi:MAG: hypothetical protein ACLP0H_20005 [Terriglobales bacterium]
MRKSLTLLVCALTLAAAAFAARTVMVSGAGIGIETDQSSADQTADQQAQTNLQNACSAGTLTSSRKIFDQCSPGPGGQYVCNVNYTGICQIGN